MFLKLNKSKNFIIPYLCNNLMQLIYKHILLPLQNDNRCRHKATNNTHWRYNATDNTTIGRSEGWIIICPEESPS